jgi:hypothetical protein
MPNIGPTPANRSISASARPPFMRPEGLLLACAALVMLVPLVQPQRRE